MIRAAATSFLNTPRVGSRTHGSLGARVSKVHGPIKTTLTLLEGNGVRLAMVCGDDCGGAAEAIKTVAGEALALNTDRVLVFSTHAHSSCALTKGELHNFKHGSKRDGTGLLPLGRQVLGDLKRAARELPSMLRPVQVWWALGREDRITYNRKGRRADGSSYLMREEDRLALGTDFRGDIDADAPVVCLKDEGGEPVTFLTQFTGHPITCYNPLAPVVYGGYPYAACEVLARQYGRSCPVPVTFFQGFAGDTNSKEMFIGGLRRSRQFGRLLGQSYVAASKRMVPSRSESLQYAVETAQVPLRPLPSLRTLLRERREINDFIRRAEAGDEDTLLCLGLNMTRKLSLRYRQKMVETMLPWSDWAIGLHKARKASSVPEHLPIRVHVLRLGDVGLVGVGAEPFLGVGRQIKERSPLPLTIPCGYMDKYFGYVPDGPNTGDNEYMSAYYRYAPGTPPFRKPGGDVIARTAVSVLKRMVAEDG